MASELSKQVLREASDWFARLNGGEADAEDRACLRDWLAARPENRQAYDFVIETCGIAATVIGRAPVRSGSSPHQPLKRWVAFGGGLALAAVLIAAVGIVVPMPPKTDRYATAIGEIRNLTLADGSILTLSGATTLDISFSHGRRDLNLKSGEVFITVGREPFRPFHVYAGGRVIEDIGTAFDVDMNGQSVDVAVSEGTVMISGPAATSATGSGVVLLKGQALTYTPDRIVGAPRTVASQQIGTWRVGILSYDRVPLEWLVADLNRQFDGGIAVPDPQLAAMPITLTLKLHDRDTTVRTLEKLLPVHAVIVAPRALELVRAKP